MKKLGLRFISTILTLCIAISLIPVSSISTSAEISADSLDKWATNQLYTRSLSTAGSILETIGEASGNEYIADFTSFINSTFCGGSDTGDKLGQLQNTCNEILDTTKKVESVAIDINSKIASDKITTNSSNCDNAFESQVMDYITKADESPYDFYNVYIAYRNYLNYATNQSSIPSGKTLDYYEDNFIRELVNYYMGKTNTNFASEKDIYTTDTIDVCLTGIINSILNTMDPNTTSVGTGKRFIDQAAQYAYYAYPYSSEQAQFLDYATEYQVNTVTYLLMIYQDFVAHRAEYLGNNKSDENDQNLEDIWENCYTKHYEPLLDKFTTTIGNFLNGDIYLKEINAHTTLDEYVRGDSVSVSYDTQKNSYVLTNNKTVQSLNNEGKTSNSTFTKNGTLSFYKSACVKAENGKLKFTPFYVLNGESLNKNYLNLKYLDITIRTTQIGINGTHGYCYDSHYLTPDYYNLKDGKFTDGINTYVPVSDPNQLKDLINETYYTANNSIPYSCFAPFMNYSKGKTNYLLLSGNTNWTNDGAVWPNSPTRYTEMPVFNMSSSTAFSANWSSQFLNAGSFSDSTYSLILVPQSDVTKTKIDTKVLGEGDINVSGLENGTAVAGEKVKVDITAPQNHNILEVSVIYNSSSNNAPKKVIYTGIDKNEITLYYPVPYSDITITVETGKISKVLNTDKNGNFIVSSRDDLYLMAEMVNSGYSKFTNGSYILTNDISFDDYTNWSTSIGTEECPFAGTFDGQGHTIHEFDFDAFATGDNFGLFSTVVGGNIKNLNLDMYTLGASKLHKSTAPVCGYIKNGSISNCTTKGYFNAASDYIGGIVATADSSTIKNCETALSFSVRKDNIVGDICGKNINSTIVDCVSDNTLLRFTF